MGEVKAISGTTIVEENGVNSECIKMAEDLLELARTGEIVGFYAVKSYRDGGVGSIWGGFNFSVNVIGEMFKAATKLASE